MQNQHYVPRTYLKSFTYDGSHLHVYDKATDQLLPMNWSSIKSTASEANFYTLPEGLTQTGNVDEVESWLQGVDSRFATLLSEVENHIKSSNPIDPKLRKELSDYISVQFVRTKMYRETMAAFYKRVVDDLTDELDVPLVRPTQEQVRAFQASQMQETTAPSVADHFAARLWFFGLNETPVPFFTSDTPVVWQEIIDSGTHKGDVILFPMTPQCILMMYDGKITEEMSKHLSKPWTLENKLVTRLNTLQIVQSHMRVYSQVDHVTECRRICEQNPSLRSIGSHEKTAENLANSDVAKAAARQLAERMTARRKR